jgi:hypothetical protein
LIDQISPEIRFTSGECRNPDGGPGELKTGERELGSPGELSTVYTGNFLDWKLFGEVLHMAGHTLRQWQGKFFRCGMRCWYCYKPLLIAAEDRDEQATKDHLTPLSRGGHDLISNIVPACFDCNQRKGTMTEQEFRKTFSEAFKILTSVAPATESNLSMVDQPSVSRLRREGESISWAWRNPA